MFCDPGERLPFGLFDLPGSLHRIVVNMLSNTIACNLAQYGRGKRIDFD